MTDDGSVNQYRVFRCDDAAGYELVVFHANDGDFHVSMRVCAQDREEIGDRSSIVGFPPSVRIRAPMTGGGAHSHLWHALVRVFRETGRHIRAAVADPNATRCSASLGRSGRCPAPATKVYKSRSVHPNRSGERRFRYAWFPRCDDHPLGRALEVRDVADPRPRPVVDPSPRPRRHVRGAA